MDCEFIEIGSSIYETLIGECSENAVGITVEPIKTYIDKLPNKPNVIKVNAAITSNRKSDLVDIFYIPEDVIDANQWPEWLKGCNRINCYHGEHFLPERMKEVRTYKVSLLNIDELFEQYNIKSVKYLKIDTEGHDCVILKGLFDYLKTQSKEKYPKKITFESNVWTKQSDIDETINYAINIGYKLINIGNDTTLVFNTQQYTQTKLIRANGRFKLI